MGSVRGRPRDLEQTGQPWWEAPTQTSGYKVTLRPVRAVRARRGWLPRGGHQQPSPLDAVRSPHLVSPTPYSSAGRQPGARLGLIPCVPRQPPWGPRRVSFRDSAVRLRLSAGRLASVLATGLHTRSLRPGSWWGGSLCPSLPRVPCGPSGTAATAL